MGISVWVGNNSYEIGASSFFNSFFSTIFVRLEQEKWGSRFPIVMRELYSGRLGYEKAEGTLIELRNIKGLLSECSPEQVVWDYEKRDALPPWGDKYQSWDNFSGEISWNFRWQGFIRRT